MAFTRVTDLVDQMVAENANQYAKTLEGDAANGRALQVYKADLVNKWLDVTKNGVLLDGIQGIQTSGIAAPGSGKEALYPKSDGHWYLRAGSGGAEIEILDAARFVAAGDLPYGSAAGAAAILTLGTKGYALLAGATAPVYDSVQRRNRLLNGDFRVWQRGTAAPTTADNAYGPDRWRVLTETTTTGFTINKETSDLPTGGSRGAAKLAIGASNNTKNGLWTILEGADIWDLRGQTASLQFKMKASDARIGDVRAVVVNWTGTEDAVAADPISVWGAAGTVPTYIAGYANANAPANLSPTTSWATYKIEGVSISASATNLAVFVWIDDKTTTAGDYLLVTDVQLEKGAICTDLERRHVAEDLTLCQRYCCKSYDLATAPGTATAVGQIHLNGDQVGNVANRSVAIPVRFPSRMRVAPAVTVYDVAGTSGVITRGAINGITAAVTDGASESGFAVTATDPNTNASLDTRFQYLATAEL
jgi:hypothetical protein